MKQDLKQARQKPSAGERLVVGAPAPVNPEHSPSFGPLWKALNTASELVVGQSLLGLVFHMSAVALAVALFLGARLVFPDSAFAVSIGVGAALGLGTLIGVIWAGRRLTRSAGRAELTAKGVRFAKPNGDRKRIPWGYVQGYSVHPRWVQLQIGDRARPVHAIPTPTPQDQARVLAFLKKSA